MAKFSDIFEDVTKQGTKIPTNLYLECGLYPIIDQGQSKIAGYTNETQGLFTDVPAIIFGDHTRIIKYVETPCFLGADGVKLLKAKDPHANYKYLYYALCHADIPNTGYNRHFKWLKEVDIREYTEQEQEHIVSQLERIDRLILLRKQQFSKLDELVKARFVEMFGDPITNPMRWKKKSFDSLCENLDYRRKPITASERQAGIYPYYGASGIVDYVADYIFDENILLVSEDGANLLMRSTPIAFSVSGKVWVNNHAHVVKFEKMSMQKYIEVFFSLISISDYITGSAQPKLNQAKLNSMMFPVPTEERLEKFLEFIEQVDKSKSEIQKSLEKLETLKKALMQKYFG